MTRSRLRNRFLKNRSEENRKLFCKQRNKGVYLLKNIIDNKRFWIIVEPFLSKKNHLHKRINLTEEENNSLLTYCEEAAK